MSRFIKDFSGSESRPSQSLLMFDISCSPILVSKELAFATIWVAPHCKFESINIEHRTQAVLKCVVKQYKVFKHNDVRVRIRILYYKILFMLRGFGYKNQIFYHKLLLHALG